jgi:hypothetical protein
MLKQIPPDKLQAGMYVDLNGIRWLDHAFVGNGILIEDETTLRKILRRNLRSSFPLPPPL